MLTPLPTQPRAPRQNAMSARPRERRQRIESALIRGVGGGRLCAREAAHAIAGA